MARREYECGYCGKAFVVPSLAASCEAMHLLEDDDDQLPFFP
jgi:hypothetical protein